MTTPAYDFLVRRDDLHRTECRPAAEPTLAPGEILLDVDVFAFTANNVTYAVFGDAMMYWNFFPAPAGWGRVPVWGFATVARSANDGVAAGERVYGYLPMSSHVVVQAGHVGPASFHDEAAHRQPMSVFYNQYLRVAADPAYDPRREAEQMLFRPLFATAFLIDDFLAVERFFGARTVVVSSASSKTSMALAFQLHRRGACKTVGLTSPNHVDFVRGLGVYGEVVTYDAVGTIDPAVPTVFVDMAGDAAVTTAVHRHFGDALRYSCAVGGTHWQRLAFGVEVPGPRPTLFFAPDRLTQRMRDWGSDGFQSRLGESWVRFLPLVDGALTIARSTGREAVERVYRATLDGTADPRTGYVLSPD